MIVLALDTTTPGGSCALARNGLAIREQGGDAAISQAARLPGDLMRLLEGEAMTLDQVDVYAVATGPGSFTGLRVGIAAMQGLAFAAGKPLIGISAFDALAVIAVGRSIGSGSGSSSPPSRIATWVDAWRGEVYAALYEDGRQIEPPSVEPPDALLQRLADRPPLFIGNAAGIHRDVIRRTIGEAARVADPAAPLLAATVAALATHEAREGHRPSPDAIRPLYVRRPDAELSRDARASR